MGIVMLKWLLTVEFYAEGGVDGIPEETSGSYDQFCSSLKEQVAEAKLSLIDLDGKAILYHLDDENNLSSYSDRNVVVANDEYGTFYLLLEVDLSEHPNNIQLIWDAIQEATTVGVRIDAFGPTEEFNGEERNAVQIFDDGEMDSGYFTSDDPEDLIIDISDQEQFVKDIWQPSE